MAAVSDPAAIDSIEMDVVLSDAVILSWSDLMPELMSGLIHIEYHVEPMGSVEYMRLWASTIRGHWDMICEHWMRRDALHQGGLHFRTGYASDTLAKTLEAIMQHQATFLIGAAPGKDHTVQVYPPTDADRAAANRMMEALQERLAA